MAVTRINNNQISDASSGNAYLGVNAASKIQDYSITSGKIANNLTYGSDLTVSGNLTVNGTSTTIDTTVTTIEDPVLVLASTQTGVPSVDIGFIGERGTSDNIAFVWDESADEFVTAFTSTSETNTTITISSYANFHTNDANIGGNISITGTTFLSGNATVGNIFFGVTKTIDAGNNVIGNVSEPIANADAATKSYVDSQVSAAGFDITDGVTTETVYPGDTITFSGVANETTVAVSSTDTITIGLPDDVTISGNLIVTSDLDANLIRSNTTISATGTVTGGNVETTGYVSASGNINGQAGLFSTVVSATGNITGSDFITAGNVEANGFISAFGNVTGQAGLFGTVVSAAGNITGSDFITSGNVDASGYVSAVGNVTGGNIITAGVVSATANITGGNIDTAGQVSATGNLYGGNAVIANNTTTGTLDVIAGPSSFQGNVGITGNLLVAGNVTYIGVQDLVVDDPIIYLAANNVADLDDIGFVGNWDNGTYQHGGLVRDHTDGTWKLFANVVAEPTTVIDWPNAIFQTYQVGTLLAANNITANSYIFATGNVESGANLVVSQAGLFGTFVSATGNITGSDFITTGNVEAGGYVSATGNVTGGNILTAGIISAVGNITGGNLRSEGAMHAVGNVLGAEFKADGNISAIGNVIANNINSSNTISTNNLSASGNIDISLNLVASGNASVGNLIASANVYAQNFFGNISGNVDAAGANTQIQYNENDILSASGNFTYDASYNSNGGLLTVGYGIGGEVQTDTVTANVGIVSNGYISAIGAISASGNITGSDIFTAGLISATGNITGSDFITTGNVEANGFISAFGNVTGQAGLFGTIVSATGNITGSDFITSGNVNANGYVTANQGNIGNIVISGDDITDTNGRVNFNTAGDDVDFAVNGDTVANVFYVDAGTGTVSFGSSTQTTGALAAFNTASSVLMPVGNTAQRPVTGVTGMLRFSTTENALEVFDNTEWKKVGVPLFTVIVDDQFNGDGSTVAFTLSQESTTAGTVVSINGVMQIPTTAYSVSGTTLTFTEAPEPGDVIDVRIFTTTSSVTTISNSSGNATVSVPDTASQVDVQGNLIPTANVTYDLGSEAYQWKDLWLSGNTIRLGNTTIKNTGGNTIGFFGPNGTTPATIDAASVDTTTISNGTSSVAVVTSGGSIRSNVGGSTIQTISSTGLAVTGVVSASGNVTGGNVLTSGIVSASGNVTGNYLLGNAFYVTGLSPTKIYNGTTEVNIGASNGNANISVGGTSNVAVFSSTGVTVSGTLTTGAQTINGLVNQTGNLNITGNLNVTGNVNYTNVNDLVVGDPLIYMAANNVSNLDDIGMVGNFDNGVYQHTGFARDASAGVWKLFSNVVAEPTNTIDFTNAIYDPIQTGAITATSGSFSSTLSAAGNVTGGNIITAGVVSAGGNITGGNLTVGSGTITVNNIVNGGSNATGNIGSSTTYFNTAFVKATSAQYADLAEKYVADAEYPAGTVVVFGGDKEVTVTSVDADRAVAGVVSTNPSYIMNGTLEAEFVATVALTGRVPCRVTGTVRKGDLMVSAGYGLARAEQDPKVGTVIGKALENFEGNEGVIEVVVGRF